MKAAVQHTGSKIDALLRRAAFLGGAVAITAITCRAFADLVALNGTTPYEWAMIAAFVPLTFWIALSSWSAVLGFFAGLLRFSPDGLAPADETADLSARTVILVPVYNEDPTPVFANIRAMYEDLRLAGTADAFDFFVLSDTTDPAVWLAEEQAWFATRADFTGDSRIFYRRRPRNLARKAGNVAEFCRRFGARYDFMIVLDADSLMSAETLGGLVRLMQANPRAGLIQSPPRLINRTSLFARLQQFAAALCLPILSRGLGFWQLGQGNFWGHNAIIRVQAFMASCGLPDLPGRPPFGGHILSHDFVEAALLVRGGWEVWMAPGLSGSWEESPPSLLDHLIRDRRWCQGNLQHAKVLPARGLHPISRLHLAMGIMSYLASPLWGVFLAAGLAEAVAASAREHNFFPGTDLFPHWLRADPQSAVLLLSLAFSLLLAPKLLAYLTLLADPARRRAMGGAIGAFVSLLLEILFSTLIAPMMMVFHSLFVAEVLLGRDSGWHRQQRNDGGLRLRDALRATSAPILVGLIAALIAAVTPGSLIWWLSPLIGGLLLSPLLVWVTASTRLGGIARRLRLLMIPEESAPPPVALRAQALTATMPRRPIADPLAALRDDRELLALHTAIIAGDPEMRADPSSLALAREKLEHGLPLQPSEQATLMADLPTVTGLLGGAAVKSAG